MREEGPAALYKGFTPKVLRLAPGGGILLLVVEVTLNFFRKGMLAFSSPRLCIDHSLQLSVPLTYRSRHAYLWSGGFHADHSIPDIASIILAKHSWDIKTT